MRIAVFVGVVGDQAIIIALMLVGRLCPLTAAYLVGSAFAPSEQSTRSELEIG